MGSLLLSVTLGAYLCLAPLGPSRAFLFHLVESSLPREPDSFAPVAPGSKQALHGAQLFHLSLAPALCSRRAGCPG